MSESTKTRLLRFAFNFYPCYRRVGARITYVAADYSEVHVKLPLTWRTRGYNGTTFGGSLYAAVDPVYLVMLSWRLGREFIVWDKGARIEFRKPGRTTLFARFRVPQPEIDAIRRELEGATKTDRVYEVEVVDGAGVVHAWCEKVLQVRRRNRGTGTSGGKDR